MDLLKYPTTVFDDIHHAPLPPPSPPPKKGETEKEEINYNN